MNDELSDFTVNPYQSPVTEPSKTSGGSAKSSRPSKERVFSSVRVLGTIVSVFFVLSIIMSVAVIVVINGPRQMLAVLGLVQAPVGLALVGLFITWFYKAYVNLPPLGVKRLDPKPGWAIGGWFVPLLCWYQPYVIAKEIWINSCPIDIGKKGRARRKPSTAPVLVWWLLWVAANILSIVFQGNMNGITVIEVVRILAAAGATYFVFTVSHWQDERHERLSELPEEQPAAETPEESNPYENYS